MATTLMSFIELGFTELDLNEREQFALGVSHSWRNQV